MLRLLLDMAYYAALTLVLANAVVSWFPRGRWSPAGRLITRLTEPVLQPFRRRLRPITVTRGVALDFSGFVLVILIAVIYYVLRLALIQ